MDDLASRKCIPCEDDGFPALTKEQAEDFLPHVPGWQLNPAATEIRREFGFRNFKDALAFVNEVGRLAEEEWHHPDIMLGWGRATVVLTTHSIRGLSENDFILAAKINLLQNGENML